MLEILTCFCVVARDLLKHLSEGTNKEEEAELNDAEHDDG